MLIDRVRRSLERRIVAANGVAVVFVTMYLVATGAPPERGSRLAATVVAIIQAVGLTTILVVVGVALARRMVGPNTRWLAEDRDPTPEERALVLSAPWMVGILPLPLWLLAAAVIGAWPDTGTAGDRARIVVGIALGGVLACTLGYVLVDRAIGELRIRALAGAAPDHPGAAGMRRRFLVTWLLGSGIPLLGIAVTPIVRSDGAGISLGFPIALLAIGGLAVGLFTTYGAAAAIAEPMGRLRHSMERVGAGDLGATLVVDAPGEVGMVQAGFNQMMDGLRERAQLQDLFGRHVGQEVARAALEEGARLGGEQREVSVFFVDLIGSSTLAREQPPDAVVALLNRFFTAVVQAADDEGGWVNKFEGDGALCVFGAPRQQENHAACALRAARRLRDALSPASGAGGLDGIEAAIGVSSGTVVAGNVGSEARYEYTVIGHPVNEAARLTDEAKRFDERLLASAAAISGAPEEAPHWRSAGIVDLRGTGSTEVFTPI